MIGVTEVLNAVVFKLNSRMAARMENPDHSLFRLNSTGNYQAVEFMGRDLWHKIVDEPVAFPPGCGWEDLESDLYIKARDIVQEVKKGLGAWEGLW